MNLITTATRMWLTRSKKPFAFTNDFDERFEYNECENLGLYIHIPFCRQICDFCPYCKEIYNSGKCNEYIDALISEIHMVGAFNGKRKRVTSLYFGGGSPALAIDRIKEIISAVNKHFEITEGIGIELHPSDVEVSMLKKLKEAGITKISIGIQSFNEKFTHILGRENYDTDKIASALAGVSFETVSMDFIFALPGQNTDDLKKDIDTAFSSGANHIAIYPFIDFTFTKSNIKAMRNKDKKTLLDEITAYCEEKGYERDSIWTFSKNRTARYSSMTRDNFLGFGCSTTTLLKEQFKINTFSVSEYTGRINENKLPTALTIKFTTRQRMIYYLFWTAYSTKISRDAFEKFFNVPLEKMYGFELFIAKLSGFIKEKDGVYQMTRKGAFYYHYYESFYTLSYIDKMWGIMRKEAFPEKMEL